MLRWLFWKEPVARVQCRSTRPRPVAQRGWSRPLHLISVRRCDHIDISLRLNFRRFFRWTGAFILIVAAGLLANSVKASHEAGLWNHGQRIVFDISGMLPMDSPQGSVLSGIFGYIDEPDVSEIIVYLGFLLPSLWFFLADRPGRLPATVAKQGRPAI